MRALLENGVFVGTWTQFEEVRDQVYQLLEKLLLEEIKFANKTDIVNRFWNFVCHDRIVELRTRMASGDNEEEKSKLHEKTQSLINNGMDEFKGLVKKMEQRYALKFETGELVDFDREKYFPVMEEAYKLCVFIGDLARYKSEFTNSTNFDEAQEWYKSAQRISPHKGRAFNQLAIIALRRKHTLDVIYFNMRNLMSATPYDATLKTLMHIFDVSKNKVELQQARLLKAGRYIAGVSRREIWIPPDSTKPLLRPSLRQANADDEQELRSKDSNVYDDFVLSFIHTLGKLFNRKGMESFRQCVAGMLCELRVLVQCSSIRISSQHYVQLISMFVFAAELLQVKAKDKKLQRAAMLEGMGMFGVLLERFIDLIEHPTADKEEEEQVPMDAEAPSAEQKPPSSPQPADGVASGAEAHDEHNEKQGGDRHKPKLFLCKEAKTLLPPMKVWVDWLMNTPVTVWHPAFCRPYLRVGTSSVNDPWGNLAKLMNILEEKGIGLPKMASEARPGFVRVLLDEEIDLAECTPWMYCNTRSLYMPAACTIADVGPRLCLRKLTFFCSHYLTSLTLPILDSLERFGARHNEDDAAEVPAGGGEPQSHWVWYVTSSGRSDTKRVARANRRTSHDDSETRERAGSASSTSTLAEIRDLLRRNVEIERGEKSLEREKQQRLQAMLAESTVPRIMEVRPRYVVLDTNCFVDDLPAVEWITTFRAFKMLIPITVVKELRGLALGDTNRPKQPLAGVAEASQLALAFLETCEPGAISYIDMDGEIVAKDSPFPPDRDTLRTNDDRILQAALSLCRDQYSDPPDVDGYIVRNVVLITNDRTLRVKAITTNMPTKALCEFIEQLQLWFPLSQGPQRASE
ncbi:telomerase-binding protein EST1A [Anopheles bellator]|uniref:telomerase-binding protein EST1A n=1 Tax=Anopheles bellator TaxID=139047 RepID=UPI002647874F|nr:telomerase-binding protein EST1A [Anopheles bellator]